MVHFILRSYSMGAGTYTGIEAVSNGMPLLREPRVQTAKKTMIYMSISLAFMAVGLIISYLLFKVEFQQAKTLNAVLFERITAGWGGPGKAFVYFTLLSEAVLLFVAAQTGFLGGPRVLSNMAMDRWVPTRFATLSDRLVTMNGIVIMGGASILLIVLARGSVRFLVILYAINVFITFSLSQLGMVKHWWQNRFAADKWKSKLFINGIGLAMTLFILTAMTVIKFREGGWITLAVTGCLVAFFARVKRHYVKVQKMLKRLDSLVSAAGASVPQGEPVSRTRRLQLDRSAKTAVVFVNGFNGLGLHTLLGAVRLFGGGFRRFVFVQIGVVDAGNFNGADEIERLHDHVQHEAGRYVEFVGARGGAAEAVTAVGHEILAELEKLLPDLVARHPQAVFFSGQLVFERETFLTRWLHNYTAFAMQRRLFLLGLPGAIVPIRVMEPALAAGATG
jgi:hypothetical protein